MKKSAIASIILALVTFGGFAWFLASGAVDLRKLTPTKPAAPSTLYDVTLHGKVVDENGDPVEGADVLVGMLDEKKVPIGFIQRVTGATGGFSGELKKVGSLSIRPIKTGYEIPGPPYGPASAAFPLDYQSDPALVSSHATAATPFVIPLFKAPFRGTGKIILKPDGAPDTLILDGATGSPAHRIEIRCWSGRMQQPENPHGKFPWSIEIRAPHGGLITKQPKDPWNKDAPAAGYVPAITFDFPESLSDDAWRNYLEHVIFIRFDDGTHGYLSFSLMASRDRFEWETGYNSIPGSTYIGGKTPGNRQR